jgi:hypothetical protein
MGQPSSRLQRLSARSQLAEDHQRWLSLKLELLPQRL